MELNDLQILELTRSFYPSIGGMEKFVEDRLVIFKKLGYDYQVITTTHTEKTLVSGKKINDVTYLPSYTPYEIVSNLKRAMESNFDILSVNQVNYYYSVQAIKQAKKLGKKIIITPHFNFHTNKYQIVKKIHLKYFVPKLFCSADKIICFTNSEAEYWSSNFSGIKNKIVIIPHYFKPPKNKSKSLISGNSDFFLFLGRGEKNKRIDLLIKAFSKIKSNYKLLLTIENDEISENIKSIVRKDIRIDLLGRVSEEEKHNLLSTCSALILPTDYEAFGIVNLEASYYKKPLLLSNLVIFNDILDEKGVLYFNNSLASLEQTIKKFLLLSEEQKTAMGKINHVNLERYSFDKVVKKYSELFYELI